MARTGSITLVALCVLALGGDCQMMQPSTAPAGAVVPLSQSSWRQWQNGDTWSYTVNSRFTDPATGRFSRLEGTRRQFVSDVEDPTLGRIVAFNIAVDRTVVEGEDRGQVVIANVQDRFTRTDEELRWVARQVGTSVSYVVEPANGVAAVQTETLFVGHTYATGIVRFDDGSTISHSQVVTAIETIAVPAGTFEAFRVEINATGDDGNGVTVSEIGSLWIVPALGADVRQRFTRTIQQADGSTVIETTAAELASTSVPF